MADISGEGRPPRRRVRVSSTSVSIDAAGVEHDRACTCTRTGPCPDDDPFAAQCPRRRHPPEMPKEQP